ncbi:disks large-associated protein 4 isoform X2 [Sarcophilus harrisii]|uniref:disks large-associated protein 4 isoform X2 n=1 Tax=Sarcophilus harrisii TaxID=9305 RepID=UPI000C7BE734|nr:disks large-associated protein 4 isoform X2 [Sarcophilus harrisii]
MKGLSGDSRGRHLSDSLEPPPPDALFPGSDRNPYLLSPTATVTADPFSRESGFPGASTAVPGDTLFPLPSPLPTSGTFPRLHYNSHFEVPEEGPFPSHAQATKINRLPANLLDQFEKQLPVHRDGFSTLQFHRAEPRPRGESPGRIRHLVHSVQKLFFAKAQSLEGGGLKGSGNGRKGGAGGGETGKGRRAKGKDSAKTAEPKRRSRSNISGWWSSDDNLDSGNSGDCGYRPPAGLMTLGRQPERAQPRYFVYNTFSEHMLKAAKNNTELPRGGAGGAGGAGGGGGGGGGGAPPPTSLPASTEASYGKRGSWSTLTLSHAREVCQKASATIDKALLKSKSCHQDLAYHYLQVPPSEWNSSLSRTGADSEIPCRRMRSGSYIKAMGDEDSEDSDTSPKPSPKTAARRQSYLKATQQSLSEQSTTHRSLDRLDSVDMLLPSKFPSWEEEYNPIGNSITESSCINQIFGQASFVPQIFSHEEQVREAELSDQYEAACSEAESATADVLDLPLPSYFRSRSHSYLRAIQAGCSQDEDSISLQSLSPPPTGSSLSSSRTLPSSSCLVAYKKTPPPVPPRTTSKPFISVTVQSSTESAQDTYLDSQDHKSEVNSQSGLSNSSDSLDSTRPPSVTQGGGGGAQAREAPELPQKNAALKNDKGTLTSEEPKAETAPKRKLSSIGIQERTRRNGFQLPEDSGPKAIDLMPPSSEYSGAPHSMSSKRDTDSDTQEANDSSCKSSERSLSDCPPHHNSINIDASPRPSAKASQIKRNLSYGDNTDPALEPSSLPPPDPWLETTSSSPLEPSPPGACRRDGYWFLKLLQAETERLEGWCCQMDKEAKENNLSEEVLGKVLSAVGSAQLLMSQKFQQFRGLCDQNLNPDSNPRPTAQDLAGFWDLLQLSIEDISMKFDELYHLKANSWQLADPPEKKEEKKPPPPVPKKPAKSRTALNRDKASDSGDRQRQEARKRLLAAKRAASVRQNSATESADSIEIYVPEAQTRL